MGIDGKTNRGKMPTSECCALRRACKEASG
jgi:hypothetical protein